MTDETTATPEPAAAPSEATVQPTADAPSDAAVIDALKRETAELKDQWVRAVAEADNVRKRAQRDIEETSKYAVARFAKDLVEVAENLDRALGSIPVERRQESDLLKNLAEGVDMTMRELLSVCERHGIRRVYPLGEKFDHNYHQAVVQIPDNEKPPGTVVQVLQAGYTIHDRLLRPAMVGVSTQGETSAQVDTTA